MHSLSRLRIILDTNLVLQDIWYSARKEKKTALQDALQNNEFWVYMAESVLQEVEPKLRELCRGDADKQIALWQTAYAPYIQSVCLKTDAYQDDPRIQSVHDPDDIPTAQLYLFLYPEFLFSGDKKHLGNFPISQEMSQISAAYRDVNDINQKIQAVNLIPVIGIAASSALWKAFRQLPPLIQVVLDGATIGALLFFRDPLIEKTSNMLKHPETQKTIKELSDLAENKMRQLSKASAYIQSRLPDTLPPMHVQDHLNEILTVIDEPLTLDNIFHYLLARGYQPTGTPNNSKRYVVSLLKKHAAFSLDHHNS